MYPGTIFNWYDQSGISETEVVVSENAPLFLAAASFDKGPEDMRVVSGQQFYRLYGNKIDFDKHGQAALQIKNIIDNGGRVLMKRVVDQDTTKGAKLANIIFSANVHTYVRIKPITDQDIADGKVGKSANELLAPFGFKDDDADPEVKYVVKETFIDPATYDPTHPEDNIIEGPVIPPNPDLIPTSYVKWESSSVESLSSIEVDAIVNIIDQNQSTYIDDGEFDLTINPATDTDPRWYTVKSTTDCKFPIIIVSDVGRGVSNKAVRFMPDYNASKNIDNFFYAGYVYEGTDMVGKTIASIFSDTVINGVNYSFGEQKSDQVQYAIYDSCLQSYIRVLSGISGWTTDKVKSNDILKLVTYRNQNIDNVALSADSIDLNAPYGIQLENGNNGRFGDCPLSTEKFDPQDPESKCPFDIYTEQLIDFFGGSFDDAIYDLDQYKIAAVVDANYPLSVKKAIAELVTFREDCFFFRDYGLNINSFRDVTDTQKTMGIYNKFIGDYLTTYQIYDPYSGKRIKVTMLYDLAGVLVNHFANGPYKPVAGISNNIILRNAIKGTINFTPRITPAVNQKELLEDTKVNYAIFDQDQCVCQTLYTSQDDYTQLSYINNVLGIQEVARAVRTSCPKFRYTFTSGVDFSSYAAEVSSVLANYRNNFAELSFEYQQSAVHASQKIFYATIKFRFNNWAQTEIFDLYALPNENVGQ